MIACDRFDDLLDALPQGGLTHPWRKELEAHAAACPRCRRILSVAGGETPEVGSVSVPDNLTEAILQRTSGRPCPRARDLLCDLTDGSLAGPDVELVRAHLDACRECAAIARVLGLHAELLPALAEITPDERFVSDVLARTTRLRRGGLAGSAERLVQRWRQVLARPRFAAEGAYLGSILLVGLVAFPGSPLQDLPRELLAAVRSSSFGSWRLPDLPVAEVEARASELTVRAQDAAGRRLSETVGLARQDIEKIAGAILSVGQRTAGTFENVIGDSDRTDNKPTVPSDNQEGETDERPR